MGRKKTTLWRGDKISVVKKGDGRDKDRKAVKRLIIARYGGLGGASLLLPF